jgi:hypothetical protein
MVAGCGEQEPAIGLQTVEARTVPRKRLWLRERDLNQRRRHGRRLPVKPEARPRGRRVLANENRRRTEPESRILTDRKIRSISGTNIPQRPSPPRGLDDAMSSEGSVRCRTNARRSGDSGDRSFTSSSRTTAVLGARRAVLRHRPSRSRVSEAARGTEGNESDRECIRTGRLGRVSTSVAAEPSRALISPMRRSPRARVAT